MQKYRFSNPASVVEVSKSPLDRPEPGNRYTIFDCLCRGFGQLYGHFFVFRVLWHNYLCNLSETVEQMINRPQRVHQFVMENFGAGFRFECERQYLAIFQPLSV